MGPTCSSGSKVKQKVMGKGVARSTAQLLGAGNRESKGGRGWPGEDDPSRNP